MNGEAQSGQGGVKRAGRKPPRRVSPRYLENAALHYLKRYASTVSQLRRILVRRVERSLRAHGGDRAEALGWVEDLLKKLGRNGLVSDPAYADSRAWSLRASGRSARTITQKLRTKGVAPDIVAQALARATAQVSEEEAARTWARKKRLGPFRARAEERQDRRRRDLAALARAGFSFATAKKVIDGSADDPSSG